jgi:hypothetical protein
LPVFKNCIKALELNFRETLNEESLKFFWDSLNGNSNEKIIKATEDILNTEKYFPVLATWKEKLKKLNPRRMVI